MDKKLNIHIIAICGALNTPLAIALKKLGHNVTGSDQEKIYPPFSLELEKNNIPVNQTIIDKNIDLVIVGAPYKSFENCVNEYNKVKEINLPYLSATNYIAKHLIKKQSILVAGSYGKTTISALLSWLLPETNYFFGGASVNNIPSCHFSDSDWSIVEADESINGLDTQAKFLYFPVKYLILTSARWEHKDSYKTEVNNLNAYKQLLEKLPVDGVLVYNPNDVDIAKILPFCQAKKIPYEQIKFDTLLIGQHNQENISAAYTLCKYLNINFDITNFSGVKRRLEVVSDKNGILVIDDFAQSATRVKSALEAIRYSYPHRPIKVYFEPHATFLQNIQSVNDFQTISNLCDQFILGKIKFSTDKNNRVIASDWKNVFNNKLYYFPIDSELVNFIKSNLHKDDILVHFSSGGLNGLNNLNKFIM